MKRMIIFASVFVLPWCFLATAQTTSGAVQNSLVSEVQFKLTDSAVHTSGEHLAQISFDGSAVVLYNSELKELYRLSKEKVEGNLSHTYSFGGYASPVTFFGDDMFFATMEVREGIPVPVNLYELNISTKRLTKVIGLNEEFVMFSQWRTSKNPEGKGRVTQTGNYVVKLGGKHYAYLRLDRLDQPGYTTGIFEITVSQNGKSIRTVGSPTLQEAITAYRSPVQGPDGRLYFLTQDYVNLGNGMHVKSWHPTEGVKTVLDFNNGGCYLSASPQLIVATCGTATNNTLYFIHEGKVQSQRPFASQNLFAKEAWAPNVNGLGSFLYSDKYTGNPTYFRPNLGIVTNGEAFPLTKSGDSLLGKPLENFWQTTAPFECKVLAATATTTYMFEPVVIQGVKHAEKVTLEGCFPGVTRENLQVFANGVRIYPDYAELFDPPTTTKLSFKPPATVGGKTEFTVAIRHASAPQGWMRSVNGVTLDLPFAFPTASITSATPMPLKPDGEIAVAWQASLSGRVTAITPPPQGIVVYPSFNATQGVFRFKPSKAGQHTLEITLENGSKIGADFEVKFTLPQITSVQNAAKDTAGLCPGAHATAFGSFASGDEIWAEYKPVPVTFASTGQINFVIPSDFGPGLIKVQVVRNNEIVQEVEVELLPACPAAFEYNGNAILTDEHGVRAMDNGNAPVPGKVYTLWSNGCGPTDPFVPTGTPAPSSPLSQVTSPVSLNIGGNEAQVLFAGLAPGLLQVCQINFVMPGVPHGSNPVPVELRIKVGEQESTSSTLTY